MLPAVLQVRDLIAVYTKPVLIADLSNREISGWSGSNSGQTASKPDNEAEHAAKVSVVHPAIIKPDVMPGGTPHSPKRPSRPPSGGSSAMP